MVTLKLLVIMVYQVICHRSVVPDQDCVIGYTVCGGSYTMSDGTTINLGENGQNEPCKENNNCCNTSIEKWCSVMDSTVM